QGVTTAIHAHCEREIDVRWSAEPIFEDIGLGSLGKIVEDAAAVVVDEHYREVQPVSGRSPKAVHVVVERYVADDQHDGICCGGGRAKRARRHAIDACGAAVSNDF